jgi:hypothetical protein
MPTRFARTVGAALLAAAAIVTPSLAAQPGPSAPPVVAVVEVAIPPFAPAFMVRGKMRETEPTYTALPGLLFKYFTLSRDEKYGGIYLWRDAATAHAWFSPAWFADVLRRRGTPAEVRFFDVVHVRDMIPGGVARDDDSDAVATLLITAARDGALTDAGGAPGLLRRYDLRTPDGHPARIDLWANARAADSYYDEARLARLRATIGEVRVEHFATPILLPSSLPENRLPGPS